MKVKTCGFLHPSSSAMQWHPSVQSSPSHLLVQQQFFKQAEVLHLHVVSSNRLSGAGAFMTSNDAKSSRLSLIHDSLVVQGHASLQTHVSTRLLGSFTALDVEVNY